MLSRLRLPILAVAGNQADDDGSSFGGHHLVNARRMRQDALGALMALGMLLPAAGAMARGPDATENTSPASASVDPTVARAAQALRKQGDIQTSLPDEPKPKQKPPMELPEWLKSLFRWLSGDGVGFVQMLGWALVAVAVFFVLYLTVPAFREMVLNLIARRRRQREAEGDGEWDWRPDAETSRNLLSEAEALAASGRYDEAVHLLLGRSLEEIGRRRPDLLKPAMTARVIGAMEAMPPAPRTAFATIAAIVERGIWARRPVAEPDWHAARDAYGAFVYGAGWKAAA